MFTPLLYAVCLTAKKFLLVAFVLCVWTFQAATWDGGKHEPEDAIRLEVPETSTTLVIYSKQSHPAMPEFDRRMEILSPGKPPQPMELIPDTSGDNILDVFVKRDHAQLRVYITSPRSFDMEERLEPGSTGTYPDVSDGPTTRALRATESFLAANPGSQMTAAQMAEDFPVQTYWIYYKGSIPSPPSDPSRFDKLTKIGHFDTRHNRWVPE